MQMYIKVLFSARVPNACSYAMPDKPQLRRSMEEMMKNETLMQEYAKIGEQACSPAHTSGTKIHAAWAIAAFTGCIL